MKAKPKLVPSVYHPIRNNFATMINQKQYHDSLFIFNDNHLQHQTAIKGNGNAIIRPYNQYSNCKPPKSAGISTGYSIRAGGFQSLGQTFINKGKEITAKDIIDSDIDEIEELIELGDYKMIIFSASDTKGNNLGTGLFDVGDDVKEYILERLRAICE